MANRPDAVLRERALRWLAMREHSRAELRAKLIRWQQRRAVLAGRVADTPGSPDDSPNRVEERDVASDPAPIDHLLDLLQTHGLLSDARFVASRVRVRAPRFGNRRIHQELARNGVQADAATAQELAQTELGRAQNVFERKFAEPAASAKELAKQARFLAGRGFSAEVIHRTLRSPRTFDKTRAGPTDGEYLGDLSGARHADLPDDDCA